VIGIDDIDITVRSGTVLTGDDLIRAQVNEPGNPADSAVQANDFSAFVTVSTETALRNALLAGTWVRIDTTIRCLSQLLVTDNAAIYLTENGKILKDYVSSGATSSTFIRTEDITNGSGYYNEIVPAHNVYIGGPGEISGEFALRVTNGSITSGSTTLNSSTANWLTTDVGRGIRIEGAGAGGADLDVNIDARISATAVAISTAASTTVSNADVTHIGKGNMIGVCGDNLVMDGFKARFWDGGRYCIGVGDDWKVRRVDWTGGQLSGSGNGGFRYMGGARLRVIDSHCASGDDTWQVVQAGTFTDPLFDVPSEDSLFLGCTGSSSSARFLIAALQDQYNDGVIRTGGMVNSINGVQFIACSGFSGGAAVVVKNTSSLGVINGVQVIRCLVDGSQGNPALGQAGAFYLDAETTSGGITNTSFTESSIINHHRPGYRVGASKIFDTIFTGGQLEKSTVNNDAIMVLEGTRTKLDGIVLNRRGATVTNVTDNGTDTILPLVFTTIN
jgi:hypothetical protein